MISPLSSLDGNVLLEVVHHDMIHLLAVVKMNWVIEAVVVAVVQAKMQCERQCLLRGAALDG